MTANGGRDEPVLSHVVYVAATPERVWSALTNGDKTRRYFFGRSMESDWQAGSRWLLRMEDGRVDSSGVVQESDWPRRLVLSWRVEWAEEYRQLPETIVTFDIAPLGEVVRLTVSEYHPTPLDEKYLEGGRRGWPVILSGLKTLLETGRPLPEFDPGF